MLSDESNENIQRVSRILELHNKVSSSNIGSPDECSELLRAVVVLLHATIEEVVRNLFVEFLPYGDTELLNDLVYSEYGPTHRSKGVLLGDLLRNHGGKLVENVILDAINAYIDRLNINNAEQLITQLKKVNINTDNLTGQLADLDQLMRRRHQIVHQMDREDNLDPTTRPISEINITTVKRWLESTINFSNEIITQADEFNRQRSLALLQEITT